MGSADTTPDDAALLAILADGIIPADTRDAGAAAVDAGPRLVERLRGGAASAIYVPGLRAARAIAEEMFGREAAALGPAEVHDLLGRLREQSPAFFKQLRMDVSALYLSDPEVWRRIGFPGPSIDSGGHPDFDQKPEE
jgi:hypothetical protein